MRSILLAGVLVPLLITTSAAADRPALGIVMSNQPAAAFPGVIVTGVVSGSPAAQIGLQPGDRIVAVNSQPVSDYHDVMRMVAAGAPGSQIRLDISRGVWHATRTAYLGEHQQVFLGKPVFRAPSAARSARWRRNAPSYYSAPYRTHPRDDLMTSLGNSDG